SSAPVAPPSRAPVVNPVIPAHVRTLANGLRVVVLEDHAAPVAMISTFYRFGASDETPGKTGLAHALEHMMFRGTTAISSAALDDWEARMGALANAQTSNEFTEYYFVLPADRVDTALHVEADRMHDLKLAASDWDRERGAVLAEWTGDYDNFFFAFGNELQRRLYPGTPYARNALGAYRDVASATVADLRRYYTTWYVPNNAVVIVTGDVDPDWVFASAERWFGPIPSRPLPARQRALPKPARAVTLTSDVTFPYPLLDLAYDAPPAVGPTAHDGLAGVLALRAMSNPLSPFRAALYDSGLTLGYSMTASLDRHIATYHMLCVVAPGHTVAQVRAAYDKTMRAVLAGGIDPALVDAAKRYSETGLISTRDSITGLSQLIGSAYVMPGDDDPTTFAAQIEGVTPADVDAIARRIFATPNAVATLRKTTADPSKVKPPSDLTNTVKDDFGGRKPDGRIVEPQWLRDDAARPLVLRSRIAPELTTFPNGMKLIVQRVPDNPTVFVRGTLAGGALLDPPGKEGLASVTSSLLGFGSTAYDEKAQDRLADELGATFGYGSWFSAHGLARDLPQLVAVLAASVRHPLLPADKFALVRSQLRTQVQQSPLSPAYQAQRAMLTALLPAHDPELREATTASLDEIDLADVRAFATSMYRPDLLTLVVVGDVDPAAVKATVAQSFGDWTAGGPNPVPHLPPLAVRPPVRKLVEVAAAEVSVQLVSVAPPFGIPDSDAFTVADALLDDGSFEGRLIKELRDKRGLVYSVGTSWSATRERGAYTISFSASPANVDRADALVRAELRRLQQEAPTEAEVRRAATRLSARAAIGEESTGTIAGELSTLGLYGLPADYYATLAERYARVTPADVQRAAREYFHPDNLVEIRAGPKQS
ncbi:MAG TPA: pitrilysin family protein, partial [Candidatus Elarobacter sp.]|nr:pitrilysin family protein [Candidatus Elarobacter sp.]